MQWMIGGALAAALLLNARTTCAQTSDDKSTTFRQAMNGRMLIGTALMSKELDDPKFAQLVADQFNCITPENEMKPDSLQHVKGVFTFDGGDRIVAFAQQHDMKVVGHNLCWQQQTPAWMFADEKNQPLSREAALANLKNHITAVVTHYRGKVIGWDVVNEAISDKPEEYLKPTPALRAIGEDYVEKAFEFAHAADPEAQLYYNDYSNESPPKLQKTIKLIRDLKAKGLRIGGIGIQSHFLVDDPSPQVVDDAISALAAEGVKVMISELDIDMLPRQRGADVAAIEKQGIDPYRNGLPPALQEKLAQRYAQLFKIFLKHPDVVKRVTFWGVDDGHSWLNNWPVRGRTNYPLLFDRALQPKPALRAVLDVLATSDAAGKS
jgi:endo-1,4-beta-xylanase